jgi:hypothetical protein
MKNLIAIGVGGVPIGIDPESVSYIMPDADRPASSKPRTLIGCGMKELRVVGTPKEVCQLLGMKWPFPDPKLKDEKSEKADTK